MVHARINAGSNTGGMRIPGILHSTTTPTTMVPLLHSRHGRYYFVYIMYPGTEHRVCIKYFDGRSLVAALRQVAHSEIATYLGRLVE